MDYETKNLRERCKEILDWHKTGLLKENGCIRKLANDLAGPEMVRLNNAEYQTNKEAMEYVLMMTTDE